MAWILTPTSQAQSWIRFDWSQSQTKLSVTIESSQNITSSHWPYAGPLDDRGQCSNREFPKLDDNLKGRAAVTKLGNKKARAEISISRANNNRLYCFIIEGSPTPRQLDYNPPIIELGDRTNLIKARDVSQGLYGPNGTVDDNSWQVAVFDASQAGSNYRCGAGNQSLKFKPISGDAKYIGQYSWGTTNHLSYNVPDHRESAIEFFEKLKKIIYDAEETDSSLIPFVDGQWNPDFTDNIHLCHRVSDPQGNTSYKLMRLDFGGPTISLRIDGRSIRASSAAVDLDDSTWQYMATEQRYIRTTCELIKSFSQPTGESAVENQATNGHYYCFLVADKQGNIGRAWIKAELGRNNQNNQPATESEPQPPAANNQQLTEPAPEPDQTSPEPIDGQTDEVSEAAPAAEAEPEAEAAGQPAETPGTTVEAEAEATPAVQSRPATTEPATTAEPKPDDFPVWALVLAVIAGLAVVIGGRLVFKAKSKDS